VGKYGTDGQGTDVTIIPRMPFAHWKLTAAGTYPEYVTHITFPRQQWLRERA